jgi:hypothetical protein
MRIIITSQVDLPPTLVVQTFSKETLLVAKDFAQSEFTAMGMSTPMRERDGEPPSKKFVNINDREKLAEIKLTVTGFAPATGCGSESNIGLFGIRFLRQGDGIDEC